MSNSKLYLSGFLFCMIIVGACGNILNFMVFLRKSMRRINTFRFLFYLSLIDFLVLIICATDTLLSFGFQVEMRLSSKWFCRIHTFITYWLTHFSSMILMVNLIIPFLFKMLVVPINKDGFVLLRLK